MTWIPDRNEQGNITTPQSVIPTTIKNEHTLVPIGLTKREFASNDFCCSITLSNKNDKTFSYSSGLTPVVGGYISQTNFQNRSKIQSVDTELETVTLENSLLQNGSAILSNPVYIDCELPQDEDYWYLWGFSFNSKNSGEDDFIDIEICDTYGVLGYGEMFTVVHYDQIWVEHARALQKLMTPDGAPGQIPKTFTIRIICFPSQPDKVTDVWIDHIITKKDS